MHLLREGKSAKRLWYAFAVCVALPSALLAILSWRAVKLENIERQQQIAQQQAQLAKLTDAAMTAALQGIERSTALDADSFELDSSGDLRFPKDRVLFPGSSYGLPGLILNVDTASNSLIEQAESAEAQGQGDAAIAAYTRLESIQSLSEWASFAVARVSYSKDPAKLHDWIASFAGTAMEDITPDGFPVALIAAGFIERLPQSAARDFIPFLQTTADRLRSGKWWLTYPQRKMEYHLLEQALQMPGARPPEQDTRAALLESFENAIRQAGPLRPDAPTRTTLEVAAGPLLLIAVPRLERPGNWQGAIYLGSSLDSFLNRELGPMRKDLAYPLAIRGQSTGRLIWGDRAADTPIAPFRNLPGWTVAVGRPAAQGNGGRQILSYSLIVLLVLVLTFGIAVTVRAVSREGELARLQSTFAAGVTHEFKSPITTIQLLMERVAGGRITSPDALNEYSKAICRETARLEQLVNRLLQTHKIGAGESHYHTAPHGLHDIAVTAAAHFQAQAEARRIRIDVDCDDLTREVELDRTAIQDCLQNLIDNAIKYSPNDTSIGVVIRHERQEAIIMVRDQGVGIDSAELSKIFNRFYRGKKGAEQCAKGTGLGLWLVKAVVEGHGGTVDVRSSPGLGSEFRIRLPIRESLPCLES
jgi:two-component system phosphate regulon sensor histidine kinase PhoR